MIVEEKVYVAMFVLKHPVEVLHALETCDEGRGRCANVMLRSCRKLFLAHANRRRRKELGRVGRRWGLGLKEWGGEISMRIGCAIVVGAEPLATGHTMSVVALLLPRLQ